jgi:hypothetical protein
VIGDRVLAALNKGLAGVWIDLTRGEPLSTPALATSIVAAIRGENRLHKSQPSYAQDGIAHPWEPISDEMQKGLALAAYICRMYGEGDVWAETIESRGEQIRGMWWMAHEAKEPAK